MHIDFETFVVLEERHRKNLLVTTVFNDAFTRYLKNEGVNKIMEVWKEGKCIDIYQTIDNFIKAGRIRAIK
ncbi:hypothetical protein [Paenibacillus aceti]|uniref:Uncharacterized protein n=1 Tax=Paenibacillus aceti TaxID=1820010 RepID=A0ABQ1VPJ9_9BACL|nr:hypothetical protein [Paenibacillus aceti]GGF87115.1 hypothetical protein GCM10010913_05740 [Paenibacillus aceti]